jgi:hypothetical protein
VTNHPTKRIRVPHGKLIVAVSAKKFFAVSGCENSLSKALEQAAGRETGRNEISSHPQPYTINIYFDNDLPSTSISPTLFSFTFSGVIMKE